jgi:preprotein translocase subunit SecG
VDKEKGIRMEIVIWALHVVAALAMIGLVLLQHGKGADMGAAFGSGASGSLFGATGSANFLSRTTAVLAAVFFLTSLGLTYLSSDRATYQGIMADQPAPAPAKKIQDSPPAKDTAAGEDSKAREIPK